MSTARSWQRFICLARWLQENRCRLLLLQTWFHLPLLSPAAVPPAQVQGTFLLITCKPAGFSRSLFHYRSFAKHSSSSTVLVEKGPEGSGRHRVGSWAQRGHHQLPGLAQTHQELGFVWHTSRHPQEMSQKAQPCFSEHLPAQQKLGGRCGGTRGQVGTQRERAPAVGHVLEVDPSSLPCSAVRFFSLPPWEGPSPRGAKQAPFPPSPRIVLPSPVLTYLPTLQSCCLCQCCWLLIEIPQTASHQHSPAVTFVGEAIVFLSQL